MAQRISSPLFVGRASELAAVERLVEQAAEGAGCALMVSGEAGIGKSRLVAEVETRLRAAHAVVLAGECVEVAEGELAFAPIVAALRPVMNDGEGVRGLEEPLRGALAALWPAVGEANASSREQLFEAVYRVLARLAEDRLVVLIIEDVHWIDRSSRDLLGFLVRNARRDRLLFVATYRPDELHRGHPLRPFLAELERSGQAQRLDLEPLARTELAAQLGAIIGTSLAGGTVDRIFARCEGNPFFAEELLATVDAGRPDDLPGSLREALLLRVERLAPATQGVLRAAAVVGRSVDHRLLGRVSGVPESDLLAALREASEHHVLVLTGRAMAYTFRHALLREAIYDDTFPGERLQLHRAIAETLATNPELATTSATAELAYHWHAAGELPAALATSLQAAEEAERMNAYDEAVGHFERALGIWDRVPEAEEIAGVARVELLLRGSDLAERAGDAERALTLGERARDATDDRTPVLAAAAETRIGRALWNAGRGQDAIEHLAEARRLVPSEPPSIQRAEALAEEGRVLMLTGRGREVRGRLEEALELATSLSAPHVQASTLNTLAIVYGLVGDMESAIASGRRGLSIANEFGSAIEILRAYVNGSQAIDDAGRPQEALTMGVEGIAAARRLGMDRAAGDQLRVQAAWRLARMGRLAEAEEVIEPAVRAATTPFNVAASRSIAGHLAAERGEFDVAERLLSEAWALMQGSGGFQLIGPAQAWMVWLDLWRGELLAAEQRVFEGLGRVSEAEPDLIYNAELYWLAVRIEADLMDRGETCADPTRRERLEARATTVLADFDQVIAGIPGDGAPPEAFAFRALAHAELTRLRGNHDPEPWRVAGEQFEALGEGSRVAYTRFRAAEALTRAGAAEEEAGALLRAAHQAAVAIGTRPFQAQIENLARRVGVTLGDHPPPSAPATRGAEPPVDDVLELLTGSRRGPRPDRLLATIMFTDIAGSTALAAELGDWRWRVLLDRHDELVRAQLSRFGGVAIKFIGDGTLSTFDGPGRAIDCACALREAVKALGIEIRAGIHTGEIEVRGDDIGGISVHIGARVAAMAGPSEILVSQTVTDAVTGSGIQFEPRGVHELKGVPGRWQLSAVLRASDRGAQSSR
jgi:class 3 adenylate cyclase/tetratricopeptide (TPR) repeat protein